jgi:hypothetical protein
MRQRWMIAVSALFTVFLAVAAEPFGAAAASGERLGGDTSQSAAPDSPNGRLTLLWRGAPVTSLAYVGCAGPGRSFRVSGTVDAFVNRPADGCEVVLENRTGGTFELCVGGGSIPLAFQQSPLGRIRPGQSVRCV